MFVLKTVQELFQTYLVWSVHLTISWYLEKNDVEHDENIVRKLERCRKIGLKLNKDKIELRIPKVKYVGHIFRKIDREKVRAIVKQTLKVPADSLDKWKFISKLADVSEPLRILTKMSVCNGKKKQVNSFPRL